MRKRKQWSYKPGSVPTALLPTVSVIYLLRMSPHGSSILPSAVSMLSGGQPSDDGLRELAASRWHSPPITRRLVVSYTHLLTLTPKRYRHFCRYATGRSFSSAISCRHRQLLLSEVERPALPGLSSRIVTMPATDRTTAFGIQKYINLAGQQNKTALFYSILTKYNYLCIQSITIKVTYSMDIKQPIRRCPVGIQTFEKIVEGNYIYIDKTEYIYRMAYSEANYFFLSRPRRFGKSLLTSTIRCYFEGRRELFKGLAIEKLEKEWHAHPVLHFDMSLGKHLDKEGLERYLGYRLAEYEHVYGIDNPAVGVNDRLTALIRRAYEQTGQKVVVLIDEYDAPLLDVIHEDRDLPLLRNVIRNFYSPLKACDPYLRFVFLTGITKFSQLSIFSELNNIKNISMLKDYAAICGITEDEMLTNMTDRIAMLAEEQELTYDETVQKLKEQYDGYHFTWPSPDIYNPFSLLNAFMDRQFDSYWFGSGTPTYLIEMLRKFKVAPSEIGGTKALSSSFDAPTERITSITPLLYQSGYITIKNFNKLTKQYTLDIPNTEIRIGLMQSLLPNYLNEHTLMGNTTIGNMYEKIVYGDMDDALRLLRDFLLTVPYCDNTDYEGHYQQLFYIIFSLFGMYVDVEVRTPRGRVDMVMRMPDKLYVMELKLGTADEAMRQIDLKDYPSRFALSGLPVVKIAIGFDREQRTIGSWEIKNCTE